LKKFLFIVLISLFCASFALAQSATPEPENWSNFAPEDEEFSIDAPITLYHPLFPVSDKKQPSRRYQNSLNGTYFFIFSDQTAKQYNLEWIAEYIKQYKTAITKGTLGEYETNLIKYSDEGDFYYTILTIKGKNRAYAFQTVSTTPGDPSVERFFNSLQFNGRSADKKLIDPKPEKGVTVAVPLVAPEVKPNPVKTVSGDGRRSDNPEAAQTPNNLPTALKIISKPRAQYTDAARFYAMEGKSILRVTFLANRSIGSISVVKKLPFGLTEQAVTAARSMTFEPATKNGVAITMTKPIEYSFTIY
jgi:hypothetical protein